MGSVIFIICFIVKTIIWDITSRLRYLFSPKNFIKFWEDFFKKMSRKTLFLGSLYGGINIKFECALREKLPDKFLLISNHQSLADIPLLVNSFPDHDLKFTAKSALKYGIPSVSIGLRYGNHAFIDRIGSFAATKRELLKLTKLQGKYVCPVVFPEGTRSRTGRLKKFHSAGIRIILDNSKLPIIVVAIEGGYKIGKFKDLFTNVKNLIYRIKVIKKYPHVSGKIQISILLDNVYKDIETQLKKWR